MSLNVIRSVAAPLPIANVDTDQLLPKQFLTTLERTGLGKGLLYDMRFDETGAPRPDFVLNRPPFDVAQILIAGPNLGCGSSREHAPWALRDFGIRCLIAPSFGDIFRANCINNAMLPISLREAEVDRLMAEAQKGGAFLVELGPQLVTAPSGAVYRFEIASSEKRRLLEGLDAIALSLRHLPAIEAFEARRYPPKGR